MSSEAVYARVQNVISTLFEVPLNEVTPETTYTNVEKWDSMGHLMLTIEIEQEFGIQLGPEQTDNMTDVKSIVAAIEVSQRSIAR